MYLFSSCIPSTGYRAGGWDSATHCYFRASVGSKPSLGFSSADANRCVFEIPALSRCLSRYIFISFLVRHCAGSGSFVSSAVPDKICECDYDLRRCSAGTFTSPCVPFHLGVREQLVHGSRKRGVVLRRLPPSSHPLLTNSLALLFLPPYRYPERYIEYRTPSRAAVRAPWSTARRVPV